MKAFLLSTAYMLELRTMLAHAKNETELFYTIVNGPFLAKTKSMPLGLGHTVMVLVNNQNQTVDRVALSNTESAVGAVNFSVKAFNDIKIPLSTKNNLLVKAIETNKPQETEDWNDTFTPVLTPEEARFNQAGAGAGCTIIYPFKARSGGAMSFSYVIPLRDIHKQHHKFMKTYTELVDHALSKR